MWRLLGFNWFKSHYEPKVQHEPAVNMNWVKIVNQMWTAYYCSFRKWTEFWAWTTPYSSHCEPSVNREPSREISTGYQNWSKYGAWPNRQKLNRENQYMTQDIFSVIHSRRCPHSMNQTGRRGAWVSRDPISSHLLHSDVAETDERIENPVLLYAALAFRLDAFFC